MLNEFIKSSGKWLLSKAIELQTLRNAGIQHNFKPILNELLDAQYSRLNVHPVDEHWWRLILKQFEFNFIAPDNLISSDVRAWLQESQNKERLISLAAEIITGNSRQNLDCRCQLVASYFAITTEQCEDSANSVIDSVIAILVAGFFCDMTPGEKRIAGMNQSLSQGQQKSRFADYETIQHQHTAMAQRDLSEILSVSVFGSQHSAQRLMCLLHRIDAQFNGDLFACSDDVRNKIQSWTGRFCVIENKLDFAKDLQLRINQQTPILDAMIQYAEGDADGAIQTLRDRQDADSRAEFFELIKKTNGWDFAMEWHKKENPDFQSEFFTHDGWMNWAITASLCDQWDAAAQVLCKIEHQWNQSPALAFIEGLINAAFLLPSSFRRRVFDSPPLYEGISPCYVPGVAEYHQRAEYCLDFIKQSSFQSRLTHHWKEALDKWRLWLQLMNPQSESARKAKSLLGEQMTDSSQAISRVIYASVFEIDFDIRPLADYLKDRKELGGLNDEEKVAEFFLSKKLMRPHEFVQYVQTNLDELQRLIQVEYWTWLYCNALADSQLDASESKKLISDLSTTLKLENHERMFDVINVHKGVDVRSRLEERLRTTNAVLDRTILISYLYTCEDWTALSQLCKQQFDDAPTLNHAKELVEVYENLHDYQSICDFLSNHNSFVAQSSELRTLQIVASFHLGDFETARTLNKDCLRDLDQPQCHLYELAIDIASGQWNSIGSTLDNVLRIANRFTPEQLMWFAQVAATKSEIRDLSIQLIKLATEGESEDPNLFAQAYQLCLEIDREDQSNSNWLTKALELSPETGGPVEFVPLEKMVKEILPQQQKMFRRFETEWLNGDMPFWMAVHVGDISAVRWLLQLPIQNSNQADERKKIPVPILPIERSNVELNDDWTIGFDLTTILVLHYLGLLKSALNSFASVKLSPHIHEVLFFEQRRVQFHQPSVVRSAKTLVQLVQQKRIMIVDKQGETPDQLVGEVSGEIAQLVALANEKQGKVVCAYPVYKAGSLDGELADLSEIDDVLISMHRFCEILNSHRKIERSECQRLKLILPQQDWDESEATDPEALNRPFFVEESVIYSLIQADVLKSISATVEIWIQNETYEHFQALADEDEYEADLIKNISDIRDVLTASVKSQNASYLPSTKSQFKAANQANDMYRGLNVYLDQYADCDAISIDDRYVHRLGLQGRIDSKHDSPRIICVLDLLQYMWGIDTLSDQEYFTALHKLRKSGFAFVPLQDNELLHWMHCGDVSSPQSLIESPEIRTIRQSTAQACFFDWLTPEENVAILQSQVNFISNTLTSLWSDSGLNMDYRWGASNWVWFNFSGILFGRQDSVRNHRTISQFYSLVLSNLVGALLCMMIVVPQDQRLLYSNWLNQVILKRLFPANDNIVSAALESTKELISRFDKIGICSGSEVLLTLPEHLQHQLLKNDQEFAIQYGLELKRRISIDSQIHVNEVCLFDAAEKVFAENSPIQITDSRGKPLTVARCEESDEIVVSWIASYKNQQQRPIPQLNLIAPQSNIRMIAVDRFLEELGPTSKFHQIRDEIKVRKFSMDEFFELVEEGNRGVVGMQRKLTHHLNNDDTLQLSNLIPENSDYYEKFAGPKPNQGQHPSEYIKVDLAAYRKDLIHKQLESGLKISCQGALCDELSPGQWLDEFGNDDIWDTLQIVNTKTNPFSLLGALDIALYRLNDDRFRQFARDAIQKLIDNDFAESVELNTYELIHRFAELALNRINLMQKSSRYPGYWKRMAAWMQAGLIVQQVVETEYPMIYDDLSKWTFNNLELSGEYAGVLNSSMEPMQFGFQRLGRVVRYEMLRRLQLLRMRHENAGRILPLSEDIDKAILECETNGVELILEFSGPLENHLKPTQAVPPPLRAEVKQAWKRKKPDILQMVMQISQFYRLEKPEIQIARKIVEYYCAGVNDLNHHSQSKSLPSYKLKRERLSSDKLESKLPSISKLFRELEHASIIAVVCGDTILANSIAEVVISLLARISDTEVMMIPVIIIQASGAMQDNEQRREWLLKIFSKVVEDAPRVSSENLYKNLLANFHAIELVLPREEWFHLKPKCRILALLQNS